MSIMVISNTKNFVSISQKLKDISISNIYFYNSRDNGNMKASMITRVPFMDVIILEQDAYNSTQFNQLITEAQARHIPVILEDCIEQLINVSP